jgi:branched-chain amino acid transport system substrate-binding protein
MSEEHGAGRRRPVARGGTWAALLSCVLLVAACGARLTDEQLAAATAGGGSGTANGSTAGSGSGAASGTGATATTTSGGSAAVAGSAGTDGSTGATGEGGTGGEAAAGACTPQPSDEVGVSDTEIHLGNVSTISGPIAGFGTTGVNGVRAYVAYINSLGGVCGRQLVLDTADDRLDVAANRSGVAQLSDEVFGFVGGTTVVDSGIAAELEGTNIAHTGLAVSDAAIASPNIFSPNPIDPAGTTQGTAAMWRYFAATQGITRVAVIFPAQADARARGLAYIPDIEAAGLAVDGPYEVSITETNYVGVAQQMENNGADAVITALEVTGMARLAQAFEQIDFQPKVPFYGAQAYGQTFLDLAGPAAEGTRIGVAYAIFEDAASTPAVADFNEWYSRVAPGSEPDFFAIIGWTGADMMVQALEAAGGAPTRDAALAFLRGLHAFDAHGFLAANDPAGKHASPDFAVVTVTGGQWVREYPTGSGFGPGS